MDIVLRPYQENMIFAAMAALKKDNYVLIQAATAAGKTIFFSKLIENLLKGWPSLRIAVLAHRRELIQQAHDKLKSVWNDAPIGIACASVKGKANIEQPVTIGSIQTLAKKINDTEPFDLVIIDEVHRLPPKNQKSQYGEWLNTMFEYNPGMRVLGVTATPFRLGHGYIYGKGCRPDNENWFNTLYYKVGIKDLQKQSFLCGYRAKAVADISDDLKRVKKTAGDFNIKDLSDIMTKGIHVGSAVKAYQTYGENRQHVVIFAVTIEHAEKLKEAFEKTGYKIGIVHSKMSMPDRDAELKKFEKGDLHFMINVGILVEGWDSTAVDCIIMCRPTKSPALYVQMTGRGLRLHKGKDDVLILDLANNCKEHGDPDSPKVEIPQRASAAADTIVKQKTCPNCKEMVATDCSECPACGYTWETAPVVENNNSVKLKNVSFKKDTPEPFVFKISNFSIEDYISQKNNRMIKLAMFDNSFLRSACVNAFLMFDPDAHEFARNKARATWLELVGNTPPESTDEAWERQQELADNIPERIQVIENGNWLNVYDWTAPINIAEQEIYEDDIPF